MPAEVDLPKEWADLIEALTLLAKGRSNDGSPFHFEDDELKVYDELTVNADPAKFTATELVRLDELGFRPNVDDDTFYSFRYGST